MQISKTSHLQLYGLPSSVTKATKINCSLEQGINRFFYLFIPREIFMALNNPIYRQINVLNFVVVKFLSENVSPIRKTPYLPIKSRAERGHPTTWSMENSLLKFYWFSSLKSTLFIISRDTSTTVSLCYLGAT